MGTRRRAGRVAAVVVAVIAAACSGGDTSDAPDVPTDEVATDDSSPAASDGPTTILSPATTPVTAPTTTITPSATTAPSPPTLTVDPAIGVADGDIVVVAATGLRQADAVIVGLCADVDPLTPDDCEAAVFTRPEGRFVRAPDGAFEAPTRIPAVFTTRAGATVDCRDPATACVLVAASVFADDPLEGPYAAIEFDPDSPLAAPGVEISATTDLRDGQPIGLSAWGFAPDAPLAVGQCRITDGEPEECETEIAVFAPRFTVDTAGRLEATVYAQIEFDAYEAVEPVSCRPPAVCELVVESPDVDASDHPSRWRFPLSFDPDAPLAAPPSVAISPSIGLADGDRVDVTIDVGIADAPSLHIVQCSGPVGPNSCDPTTGLWFVDANAGEPLTMLARAQLTTGDGRTVDCRTSPAACYVAVSTDPESSPRRWGTAVLGFDPNAPLAPPPDLRIIGGNEVDEREYVTITGEGFVPNAAVQAALCATDWVHSNACSQASTWSQADDDGRVELSLPMLATAGPAECTTAGACEVRVVPGDRFAGYDQRTSGVAPVTVRPLVADERYVEPIFDEVEHRAGIVYGRGLDNDGEQVDLTLDLHLPRGDPAVDRPVIIWGGGNATEFARRGFVVVTAPTNVPVLASRESIELAYHNVVPVLAWLDEHADELAVDPDRIAAAGQSRGGFISTSLAYAPAAADGEPPQIAAAISIAGGSVTDLIERGEPPSLMLHGELDGRVPIVIAEETCRAADAVGVRCELVVYEGRGHEVGVWNDLIFDIWDRVGRFLVDVLDLR